MGELVAMDIRDPKEASVFDEGEVVASGEG